MSGKPSFTARLFWKISANLAVEKKGTKHPCFSFLFRSLQISRLFVFFYGLCELTLVVTGLLKSLARENKTGRLKKNNFWVQASGENLSQVIKSAFKHCGTHKGFLKNNNGNQDLTHYVENRSNLSLDYRGVVETLLQRDTRWRKEIQVLNPSYTFYSIL